MMPLVASASWYWPFGGGRDADLLGIMAEHDLVPGPELGLAEDPGRLEKPDVLLVQHIGHALGGGPEV